MTTIEGRPATVTNSPLIAPRPAPRATVAIRTPGIGRPQRANRPAATPQTQNCDPIEISICRHRITAVIPAAATRIGAFATSIARS